VQEAGDLHGHLLASPRRARDQGRLGHVGRHGDADAAHYRYRAIETTIPLRNVLGI
jgi:hypothetical protein